MTKYFVCMLGLLLVSQVFAVPVAEESHLEEQLREIHNVKDFEPRTEVLTRIIRGVDQGTGAQGSKGKPNSKGITRTKVLASNQDRSATQQEPLSQFNVDSSPELQVQQDQELNGNAELMNSGERSAQDLLSQESNPQARHHKMGHKKGYGAEFSYIPEYQTTYEEQPIIQPVVHQKPVLFHQEVIKPIVHEIVKPLPVYHETIKPVVHEVIKTMPIVKEVVKQVPVVHEIIKPYTVPVVHPVEFHHQPTHISVPMQWNCQLVPGHGRPVVSGIQDGYGSYGSYSSGLSTGFSQGGSYSLGSYGFGGGHTSGLGTYSLPIKTLPAKIIGGHHHGGYKSSAQARDSMTDDIENMIQSEELSYSSMGPPSGMDSSQTSMKSMAQENPQLFAKMVGGMNGKGKDMMAIDRRLQAPIEASRKNAPFNYYQTPQEQIRGLPMGMRQAQYNLRAGQIPMRGYRMQQLPWSKTQAEQMYPPMPWEQQRSVDLDQQSALEQMRSAQEQQLAMEQMRSAQEQQLAMEQMRSAQEQQMAMEQMRSPSEQYRSAEMPRQYISSVDSSY